MSLRQDKLRSLRLFLTAEYGCNYLPGRLARNLVADPGAVNNAAYGQLIQLGFRRSGSHVYRPHCIQCSQCLSLRIPVQRFQPNRSQQRTWKKNQDLTVRRLKCQFRHDHYRLFECYVKSRHPKGGMDDTHPESYFSFITAPWSHTFFYEFRLDSRLLAVAVADPLDNGLSAVYTFFDPDESARSLGTYAILWQIADLKRLNLDWVYLGYWIQGCGKMTYKANFNPHEVFMAGRWITPASPH
jgi:arginyl-tRNA--protein-N-Asp/Glu arginylyltransferase